MCARVLLHRGDAIIAWFQGAVNSFLRFSQFRAILYHMDEDDDDERDDGASQNLPQLFNAPEIDIANPDRDEGALDRYAPMLESAAVSTLFSVMASGRATPGERLDAASRALRAIGKESKPVPQTPLGGVTFNILGDVRNAMLGLASANEAMKRSPERVVREEGSDGV